MGNSGKLWRGGLDIQKGLEFELVGEGIISIVRSLFLPAEN